MKKYPTCYPKRKPSNRLPGYEYNRPGAYFIIICTHKRQNLFGALDENRVVLNNIGKIVESEWYRTGYLRANVGIFKDEFIINPNHFHGIIWILDVGETGPVARINPGGIQPNSLGSIIGQFKSQVTRKVNQIRETPKQSVWQRNYYERIIRNVKELNYIRNYIENNPYVSE